MPKPSVLACLLILFASCTSNRNLAEQAYLREDWDTASDAYAAALKDATAPEEINEIKPKLLDSQKRAAAANLKKANELIAIGDISGAFIRANRAFELNPTSEIQNLLSDLRVREGKRLLAEGKAAADHQKWDEAVDRLTKSVSLAPNEETRTLLETFKEQAQKYHKAQFELAFAGARERLKRRDWAGASARYIEAHQHFRTAESAREGEFAQLMADAEKSADSGSAFTQMTAVNNFTKARGFGIDTDYVNARLQRVAPRNYVITVHGAIILPCKPQSNKPWDGFGNSVAGIEKLLQTLGSFAGPTGSVVGGLSGEVLSLSTNAIAAPDCFVTIRIGNQVYGGRGTMKRDEYQPIWDVSFGCENVTGADSRIVNIEITDADETSDDNVGSYQTTLGELVSHEGPRTIAMFSQDGVLHAGGILALKISIEKQ